MADEQRDRAGEPPALPGGPHERAELVERDPVPRPPSFRVVAATAKRNAATSAGARSPRSGGAAVIAAGAGVIQSAAVTRPALALVLAVVALAVSGCGKKSQPPTATDWANSVCTAITTWTGALSSTADSLKSGNLDKASLQDAAKQVKDATSTFADDLRTAGKPNTQSGRQAQQALDDLSGQIDSSMKTIQDSVDGASGVTGALTAISAVSSTLVTMGNEVRSTYQQLSKLDASGELQDAFKQADACAPLRKNG
jgi:hypothetical protein